MTTNTKIKGHEKFVLREGWLTKGLNAVRKNPMVFTGINGADDLGVGTNMVKAIRYYLQAFSLIDDKGAKGAYLTELGKVIAEKDLYIEDDFSLCMLHLAITQNEEKATSWYLVFDQTELYEFTKDQLAAYVKRELFARYGKEYPDGSIKDDIDVLLNMYGRSDLGADPEDKMTSPLASLGLITKTDEGYAMKSPSLQKVSKDVCQYVVLMLKGEDNSVSIDSVCKFMEKKLHLSWVQTNELLDALDREESIRVDRTAGLDMIYTDSTETPTEIINNHYKG